MKAFIVLLCVISLVYCKSLGHPRPEVPYNTCINMWDEGCINGQLNGAGGDDYYLGGNGFNPGKRELNRCINMWDEGCINDQLTGAGGDDYYLGPGGFNPGKRSLQDFFKKLQYNRHNLNLSM